MADSRKASRPHDRSAVRREQVDEELNDNRQHALTSQASEPVPERVHVHLQTATTWTEPLTLSTLALGLITLVLVWQTHRDAAEAINVAQKQSKELIQLTTSLAAMEDRPWLSLACIDFPEQKTDAVEAKCLLQNTGKSTALHFSAKSDLVVSSVEPNETDFRLDDTKDMPQSVAVGTNFIITFGAAFRPQTIADYKAQRKRVYIRVLLTYSDSFNVKYTTPLCLAHLYGAPPNENSYCTVQ
ncbi:MAG: hypothetical protein JO340_06975 [Acidobacteriaceae bacterium]|nr:hypothetical protein [Acidobacteriaceae bacterium]